MESLISKKELLRQTQISYGQLYRWKRKGLIPEDWFIRKSTYTGQETFFPKEAILERIQWILALKDDVALDDMAHQLHHMAGPEKLPWELLGDILQVDGRTECASSLTRSELFVWMARERMTRAHFPGSGTGGLDTFLSSVPIEWLEKPRALLLVFWMGDYGRYFVTDGWQSVHFGDSRPEFSLPIGEVWEHAKAVWNLAVQRLEAMH